MYASGREDAVRRKGKKEKKIPNMRTEMRKSRSVWHDIYIVQHYMVEFTLKRQGGQIGPNDLNVPWQR
jgi:hypothetical protein